MSEAGDVLDFLRARFTRLDERLDRIDRKLDEAVTRLDRIERRLDLASDMAAPAP